MTSHTACHSFAERINTSRASRGWTPNSNMLLCPYCDRPAELVGGNVIYPHRPDLFAKRFWNCAPCGAYVGCHPAATASGGGQGDGTVPLGRLANAELRRLKMKAHAAFDPLWKSRRMSRHAAYQWLSKELRISAANTHIGLFDEDACRAVVAAVDRLDVTAFGGTK